jgi:pyruvate dehydrogenase E2 component (dihydrolipoamide acetyltransferase)
MPSFGMYTAEGNLGRWLVPAGSVVEAGDLIVEIVTEKATYEVESPGAGILHPVAVEGETLTVEGLIGWILAEGEAPPVSSSKPHPRPLSRGERGDLAEREELVGGAVRALDVFQDTQSGPYGNPARKSPPSPPGRGAGGEASEGTRPDLAERIKASPIAKRLATEKGIDLATLTGTGPGGRIVEADVLAAASVAPREALWKVRERLPLAGARKTIAERLRRSVDTAVSLTLTREVRVEALVEVRKNLSISWDALLIKIFAESLRERPELNAVIEDGAILLLDEVHVGFAVSLPGGLVVPVVRDADSRPLSEIAADIRDLAGRARSGILRPQDVLGGTATVTNLGAHGIDAFTPVLNPPQSAILGVGRIAQRPVVEEGSLAVGWTCVLSLTFDHRVTDGAPAADLLAAVARRMNELPRS